MNRLVDLKRFYNLLTRQAEEIGGAALLREQVSKLPTRGVYFFFEEGEFRAESGSGSRVVRVGTHALSAGSRSTLHQRLRQHLGTKSGNGNHRGSIFRLLVGQALMASGRNAICGSWGLKGTSGQAATMLQVAPDTLKSSESVLEQAVSRYIGNMQVVWLNVPDEPGHDSLRGRIERNAIALLSNKDREQLDSASAAWLGRHSNRELVVSSGLWNQNHVRETHDPAFLDHLEILMEVARNARVH